ncbi:GNAT family N-acetyltransferase [Roseiterribacter gracilis]
MQPSLRDLALFEERLAFLAGQREALHRHPDRIEIVADRPELATVIPLADIGLNPGWSSVTLLPWVALNWDDDLRAAGFERTERMAFMERPIEQTIAVRDVPDLTIERVADEAGADAFATIQAECFPIPSEPDPARRLLYFRTRVLRAMNQQGAIYLLARVDGEVRAITMVQIAAGVAGVYLVGTKASARGQGLATVLLREAQRLAADAGCSALKLQANADGAAYGIYTRAGFVERFQTTIWRKRPTTPDS